MVALLCAKQYILIVYLFYSYQRTSSSHAHNVSLPTSPLVTISLLSLSMSLFWFLIFERLGFFVYKRGTLIIPILTNKTTLEKRNPH